MYAAILVYRLLLRTVGGYHIVAVFRMERRLISIISVSSVSLNVRIIIFLRSSFRKHDRRDLLDVLSAEHGKQIFTLLPASPSTSADDCIVAPASRKACQLQSTSAKMCTISAISAREVFAQVPSKQSAVPNIRVSWSDACFLARRSLSAI